MTSSKKNIRSKKQEKNLTNDERIARKIKRVKWQQQISPVGLKSKDLAKKPSQPQTLWGVFFKSLGIVAWLIASLLLSAIMTVITLMICGQDVRKFDNLSLILVNAMLMALFLFMAVIFPAFIKARKYKGTDFNSKRATLQLLGLDRLPKLVDLSTWAKLTPAFYAVLIVVTLILSLIVSQNVLNQTQDLGFKTTNNSPIELLAIMAMLALFTPICEELIMRGFLYGRLRQMMKFLPAAIVTSLLFAIAHMQINVGIMTFILSFFACYMRERTGAIYAGIGLHITANLIASLLLFMPR